MKEIFLAPVVSEKVYGLSTSNNRFAFIVPKEANKHAVARAVEAQYGVEVANVAIINNTGKAVRTYRNRRFTNGVRSDSKKAYVTLKAGHSLPIFAAVEEAAKEEKPAKSTESKSVPKTKTTVTVDSSAKKGILRRRKSGDK